MSINTRTGRTDTAVRTGIAARLAEMQDRADNATEVPALANAVESVLDYVARCEESGITMQPGDVRRLIAASLEVTA